MKKDINDKEILKVKEIIAEKKKKIEKMSTTFAAKTNCVLELKGRKPCNFHVAKKSELLEIVRELLLIQKGNELVKNAEFNFEEEDFFIGGFPVEDWLDDIKAKIDTLSIRDEKTKLDELEKRLHDLLSDDKKVELELDEIKKMV